MLCGSCTVFVCSIVWLFINVVVFFFDLDSADPLSPCTFRICLRRAFSCANFFWQIGQCRISSPVCIFLCTRSRNWLTVATPQTSHLNACPVACTRRCKSSLYTLSNVSEQSSYVQAIAREVACFLSTWSRNSRGVTNRCPHVVQAWFLMPKWYLKWILRLFFVAKVLNQRDN